MKIGATSKMTSFQIVALVLSCRILINFGFTPTVILPPANQDAWIVDLLTGVYIAICYIPPLFLCNKFKNIFITEYFEIILGKWVGKIASFLLALYLLSWPFTFTAVFLDFIKSAALVTTPKYVIVGMLLVITAYSAYKGINSIAKAAEILVFYIVGVIIIFTVLSINKMDFSVFLPVLRDSDFLTVNGSALFFGAGRFSDGVFFLVISAFLDKKYSVNKSFFVMLSLGTLLYMLMTVSTQAVLGIELPKHMNFPYYEFTKHIDVFNIFQRIEFLNIIGWVFGFFFKLSAFTAVSALMMKEIFNVKSEKSFIIPMMIIIFILLFITGITNNAVYREILFESIYYLISFFTYLIPYIVVVVYFIRRKAIADKLANMPVE